MSFKTLTKMYSFYSTFWRKSLVGCRQWYTFPLSNNILFTSTSREIAMPSIGTGTRFECPQGSSFPRNNYCTRVCTSSGRRGFCRVCFLHFRRYEIKRLLKFSRATTKTLLDYHFHPRISSLAHKCRVCIEGERCVCVCEWISPEKAKIKWKIKTRHEKRCPNRVWILF